MEINIKMMPFKNIAKGLEYWAIFSALVYPPYGLNLKTITPEFVV